MSKHCVKCGTRAYSDYCFRCKPRSPIRSTKPLPRQSKPIRQRGKRTIEYEHWRDTVARPYLTEKYGNMCDECGVLSGSLDVAHIQGRGRSPATKMVLSNVRYLCRTCHNLESGIKW